MSEPPIEERSRYSRTLRDGVVSAALLILMALSLFEPLYLRIFTFDRKNMAAYHEALPYRRMAGLPLFAAEIRARTREGEAIALLSPETAWNGYDHLFHRTSFLLYDRRVLPILLPGDAIRRRSLEEASAVAAWRGAPALAGFAPIWSSGDGVLYRRIR